MKRLGHSAQLIIPKTGAIDHAQGFDGKSKLTINARATRPLLMY